jgi:hypothetical protein
MSCQRVYVINLFHPVILLQRHRIKTPHLPHHGMKDGLQTSHDLSTVEFGLINSSSARMTTPF